MTDRRIHVLALALVLPWLGSLAGPAYGGNGDFDGDGILNLADFAAFQRCFTGSSAGSITSVCAPGDRDLDNDIDLNDWAEIRLRFGFSLGVPKIDRLVPAPGTWIVDDQGLTEVRVGFNKPVTIPSDAISIWTVGGGSLTAFTQTYDEALRVLTVSFDSAVRDDRLTIVVDYSIVDVDGQELDGEIPAPANASLPSGNGVRGGQAVFRINILQGDANCDGLVDDADLAIIVASNGLCDGDPGFDSNADLNGDGCVNAIDANIFIAAQGRTLPPVDGVLPSVVQITPDPSLVLPLDLTEVQVRFSEAIGNFSFNRRSLFLIDSNDALIVPLSVTPSAPGDVATFQFAGPLPQCADYTLNISNAFADTSGMLATSTDQSVLSGFRPPPPPTVGPHVSSTKDTNITLAVSTFGSTTLAVNGTSGNQSVPTDPAGGAVDVNITLLPNRPNQLFFTATSACGVTSPVASTTISNDSQAPDVFIDFPQDGAQIQASTTDVAGRVGDRLSGFEGLTVLVNGQPAEVDIGIGTNGTFFLPGLVLSESLPTDIVVTATDSLGNQKVTSITVQRQEIPAGSPSMGITGGNAQTGQVEQSLVDALSVQMLRGDSTPFVGKIVTFHVTRSNGRLAAALGGTGSRTLQVRTDDQGMAQSFLTLGSDAGCGNNRVEVTSRDIAGTVRFCATATPAPADRILIGDINNQRGEAGAPLPLPLRVWVSDANNGVSGVPVTYTVVEGDGVFTNGLSEITQSTDATGHVDMSFTLGMTPGNNIVEATFTSNPGLPATFIATGIARSPDQPTTLTGTVLDNANRALGGATVTLKIGGASDVSVSTDVNGQFVFSGIASGAAEVVADGSTATMLDGQPIALSTFPLVGQEIVVVPNAANELSGPILLPMLDPINTVVYDGTTDVTLTVDGIEGLALTVRAGTRVTLPDGTVIDGTTGASVPLQLNQVHFDDIPMPLPDGAFAPFAWTLQPKGAMFDPPVAVALPNMAGLDPGSVAYILQWDGQMNEFVITASGQVSDDGSIINSDTGVGITVAGWGGFCPPYPDTGSINNEQDAPPSCNEQVASLRPAGGAYCPVPDDFLTDSNPEWQRATQKTYSRGTQQAIGALAGGCIFGFLGGLFAPPLGPVLGCAIAAEAGATAVIISRNIEQFQNTQDCLNAGKALKVLTQPAVSRDGDPVLALLDDAFSLIEPFSLSGTEITPVINAQFDALIAEANSLAGGNILRYVIDLAVQTETEFAGQGLGHPRGSLPDRPVHFVAILLDESYIDSWQTAAPGEVLQVVRGRTVSEDSYGFLVPDGKLLVSVMFYDDVLQTFGIIPGTVTDALNGAVASPVMVSVNSLQDLGFVDTDSDGLLDPVELVLGTLTFVKDSDGDGEEDQTELTQGTNPTRVMDSRWTVTVGGQRATVADDGTFTANNVPVATAPVRVTGRKVLSDGTSRFIASDIFLEVIDQGTVTIADSDISISDTPFPTPVILGGVVQFSVLEPGQQTTLIVTAEMSDSSQQQLQTLADGTVYRSSNQTIATVSEDGIVTGISPGAALITVSNQGVTAVKRITVVEMAVSTTVEGFVVFEDGSPAVGVTVETNFGGMAVTDANGFFSILLNQAPPDTSVIVFATLDVLGEPFGGDSAPTVVVANGITDAGIIVLRAFQVTSPNGGEMWGAGTTQTVEWAAFNPAGSVDIRLFKAGVFHSFLGTALMADQSFAWEICTAFGDADDYSVEMSGTNAFGVAVSDASNDNFSITGSLDAFTVNSPNGGELWLAGTTQTITWTGSAVGTVSLDLFKGREFHSTLAHVPAVDEFFDWDICAAFGGGDDYSVHISGTDDCGRFVEDFSDADFSITGSLAPSIVVVTPNGGEVWPAGSTQDINWSAAGITGDVWLELIKGGDRVSCEQAWHISADGTPSSCWFDVTDNECKGCGPNNEGVGSCVNTCDTCDQDPSRTIFAGGPFTNACGQFDGDQDSCELAYHRGDAGIASCWYDSATNQCKGCGPSNEAAGTCVNTCDPASCEDDPSRTIFVTAPQACRQFSGDATSCEQAWHISADGTPSSCWFDVTDNECKGCGPSNEGVALCVNTCDTCDQDPSRTIFAGGPGTSACRQFDGDQASCELAYHRGNDGLASCWYDNATNQCKGCGSNNEAAGNCVNTCDPASCEEDPSRTIFVTAPQACRQFSGGFHSVIGNAPAADGMFTWDICSVIGDGEDYSVRISGTDDCGRTVEDFSDAVFSITGSLVPSLTLLTPIGGEQWSAGETQTITWASDAVAAVVLELYQGGEFHATIAIVLAASGSFEWDICSSIGDGDDYSIRIWGIDNCLEIIEDFSDPIFSITGSLVPSVALIAPNGGEMWETGTIQTIQWSSDSPDGFVEIEILKSGSFVTYATVFRAMAADGQLNWLIDPGLEEGSDYSVRIKVKTCLGTGTGVEDISESDFTIVLGPELDFRILSPNGGEALQAGTPQTISWTPLDIVQPIFLELFKAGEFHSFIALVDIGVGSIDWDICGDIPDGNDYSIHLDPFFQNQFLEDFSDAEFSITGATSLPVPMVTVVAPNGGEVIETGTLQTIEWASTNPVGNVTVWLLKDGLIRRLLAIAPMADEQFSWSVETDLEEADDYTVRIVITACLSGTFLRTDDSDAPFAIVPGVEP